MNESPPTREEIALIVKEILENLNLVKKDELVETNKRLERLTHSLAQSGFLPDYGDWVVK